LLGSFITKKRNDLIGYSINTLYDEAFREYGIQIPMENINTLALHAIYIGFHRALNPADPSVLSYEA